MAIHMAPVRVSLLRPRFGQTMQPRPWQQQATDAIDQSVAATLNAPLAHGITRKNVLSLMFALVAEKQPATDALNTRRKATYDEAYAKYARKQALRDRFWPLKLLTLKPKKPETPHTLRPWLRQYQIETRLAGSVGEAHRPHMKGALVAILDRMQKEGLVYKSRFMGEEEDIVLGALIGETTWLPSPLAEHLKAEILKD